MEIMPGLLSMVRLLRANDLYLVVGESPEPQQVDLCSITGKAHRMRGVPLKAILDVVESSP